MKGIPDKFHLSLSTSKMVTMIFQDVNLMNSKSEKLLDIITLDSNFSFQSHVDNFCKKASSKILILVRVSPNINIRQRRMMMRALFNSQFGYCPLIWVFHGRMANNKINKLHERCLQIICNNKYLS